MPCYRPEPAAAPLSQILTPMYPLAPVTTGAEPRWSAGWITPAQPSRSRMWAGRAVGGQRGQDEGPSATTAVMRCVECVPPVPSSCVCPTSTPSTPTSAHSVHKRPLPPASPNSPRRCPPPQQLQLELSVLLPAGQVPGPPRRFCHPDVRPRRATQEARPQARHQHCRACA